MKIILAIIALALASSAHATKPTTSQKQNQGQDQSQAQVVNVNIEQPAGGAGAQSAPEVNATTSATSQGGGGGLGGEGGDVMSVNTSQFYALSLMQPMAVDCFTSVQGGAAGNEVSKGVSGFLGFYKLNLSCWMDKKADEEQDIHINAMLLCHDKHYRNALAYDVKNKGDARRILCIQRKEDSGRAQMVDFQRELDELAAQQRREAERLASCHERIEDANERTERCVAALITGGK
jgi:hypothetical protein